MTANVGDFGREDLVRLGVSAVNPDLFLARTMTEDMYRFTLERIAAKRSMEPRTAESIHASLGKAHPFLVSAMREAYPGVELLAPTGAPPAEVFRGNRCLVCGKTLSDPESLAMGVGPECRRKS